jgi:hypothetical protein
MNKTQPSLTAMLGEALPLICTIAVAGPPVVFLVLPWLVLGLMLSGWFALLLTFVAAFLALLALVVALVALVMVPVALVRRYERRERVAVPVPASLQVAS